MAGFSTPPEDAPEAVRGYVPGSNPTAESYDVPEGSQGVYDPDRDTVPSADSNETVFGDPNDPEYAFSNSPLDPTDRGYVQLSGIDFDEENDIITIPITEVE